MSIASNIILLISIGFANICDISPLIVNGREQEFRHLTIQFPQLKIRQIEIQKAILSENEFPVATKISSIDQLPIEDHTEYKDEIPYNKVNRTVLLERANELTPERRIQLVQIFNLLQDRKSMLAYIDSLFKDSALETSQSVLEKDRKLLADGKVSPLAIMKVIAERFHKKGMDLGHFNTDPRSDQYNKNFRQMLRNGPFVDHSAGVILGDDHGRFSHMIQRDYISQIFNQNIEQENELYDFFSGPKNIHWWVIIFDGMNIGWTSPEILNRFLFKSFADYSFPYSRLL